MNTASGPRTSRHVRERKAPYFKGRPPLNSPLAPGASAKIVAGQLEAGAGFEEDPKKRVRKQIASACPIKLGATSTRPPRNSRQQPPPCQLRPGRWALGGNSDLRFDDGNLESPWLTSATARLQQQTGRFGGSRHQQRSPAAASTSSMLACASSEIPQKPPVLIWRLRHPHDMAQRLPPWAMPLVDNAAPAGDRTSAARSKLRQQNLQQVLAEQHRATGHGGSYVNRRGAYSDPSVRTS